MVRDHQIVQAAVRHRIVTQLERITGGRAELGGFHVVPFRFRVEVRDLTIHGLESPKEEPYVHVDRLIANVHIISVLGADLGFRSVIIDHPSIHVLRYPDGRTNQPGPTLVKSSASDAIEKLFSGFHQLSGDPAWPLHVERTTGSVGFHSERSFRLT